MKQKFLVVSTLALMLSGAALSAGAADTAAKDLGETADASVATRTITIVKKTKYVDVKKGEIVKFVVDDKVFTWNFDGKSRKSKFNMNSIAPSGFLDHTVNVYLDRTPPPES